MVNEEIFEGLRRATGKGGTLKSAMMSFYNSGYSKQEIEESAKALQAYKQGQPVQFASPTTSQQPISQAQSIQPAQIVQQNIPQVATAIQQIPQQIQQQIPQQMNQQIASDYNPKSKISGLTIALIIFLILLFGALISMFVFKDALIGFLNNMFS